MRPPSHRLPVDHGAGRSARRWGAGGPPPRRAVDLLRERARRHHRLGAGRNEPVIPLVIFVVATIGLVVSATFLPLVFYAQAVCRLSPTRLALPTAPVAITTDVLAPRAMPTQAMRGECSVAQLPHGCRNRSPQQWRNRSCCPRFACCSGSSTTTTSSTRRPGGYGFGPRHVRRVPPGL
jgi:hypothetical protein